MLIIFYIIFYTITMCQVDGFPHGSKDVIFLKRNPISTEERIEEDATAVEKNSGVEDGAEIEPLIENADLVSKKRAPLLESEVKNGELVLNGRESISKRGRSAEDSRYPSYPGYPSYPPFFIINNPEHVGDGARLRLDFVRPGGNGSCPNFRGTAEVVAGKWGFPGLPPPEAPNMFGATNELPPNIVGATNELPPEFEVATGGDFRDATTTSTTTSTTTTTTTLAPITTASTTSKSSRKSKRPGFFKEVEEFFRHSFHMDKTTTPVDSKTKKKTTPSYRAPEVTPSSFESRPHLPSGIDSNSLLQGHDDPARERAPKSFKTKQPSAGTGRDATFNLRIKAIAVPRPKEIRKTGS